MPSPVWVDGSTPLNSANMTQLQTRDEKASANGYASLDATAKVPLAQLPSTVPTGALLDFAGAAAPAGWLLCDGTAVSRSTYAALFAVVGVVYGAGDGSSTFNLPDTRGRVTVGVGTQAEVAALGANDGTAIAARRVRHAHSIGSLTANNNLSASHNLSAPHNLSLPAHAHSITDQIHGHLYDGWGPSSVAVSGGVDNSMAPLAPFTGNGFTLATRNSGTGITGTNNPTSFPGINGGVSIAGGVTINGGVTLAGTPGVAGGTTDGPSFVACNKIIKT